MQIKESTLKNSKISCLRGVGESAKNIYNYILTLKKKKLKILAHLWPAALLSKTGPKSCLWCKSSNLNNTKIMPKGVGEPATTTSGQRITEPYQIHLNPTMELSPYTIFSNDIVPYMVIGFDSMCWDYIAKSINVSSCGVHYCSLQWLIV